MNYIAEDILMHYGTKYHSGRYPYGSGEDPYQHDGDFLTRVERMRKDGFSYTDENGKTWHGDTAIAKYFDMSSSDFRREISWANYTRRALDVSRAKNLKSQGLNTSEIAREMGVNESTVRSWFNKDSETRMNQAKETADFIKKQIETRGMIDVGAGVEQELNISRERLDMALYALEAEGYPVYSGRFKQVTNPGQWTTQKVICPPDTPYKDIYQLDKVHSLKDYISRDGGETYEKKFTYPESMDSKRLMIRYDEQGGTAKDGVIELRRGVPDLSLGESRYSQVRILVDGTHYLKGMAVYSDNMPDGVDVIFNTNKKQGTPMTKVLKEIKPDPDNPFGSLIKDADQGGQYWYTDAKTGEKKLGLINKRANEGDWTDWKDSLPSQFLSKQNLSLAKKQLSLAIADKTDEYDEICSLTNPTVKKYWLNKFAEDCDASAVRLQAAALPGQKYHVILPINSLKENEAYAPQYESGTKLALVRYPHGGTFEIPIVTVNNKNKEGIKTIGPQAIDGIGINSKIANRLSGADFDGDTVMCIPTHDAKGKVKITSKPPLKQLEGFDPKIAYGGTKTVDADGVTHYTRNGHEYPIMKDTQKQMGVISNLITDMTLAGASDDKLARAVKHSMVVIDAEKHKLDYKQSEIDNNIAALKKEFQVGVDKNGNVKYGGASTILSRSKGEYTVDKRQGSYKINIPGKDYYDPTKPDGAKLWKTADDLYYPDRKYDKKTGTMTITTTDGKKITYPVGDKKANEKYSPIQREDPNTGEVYFTNKAGDISYKVKTRTQKSTKMAETDDAYSLVSTARHPMELAYAEYANDMKALGNRARMEIANTGKIAYSADAKKKYQTEVSSLDRKLKEALSNTPRERQALRLANAEVKAKRLENPDMKKEDIKKASQQAVTKYRAEVGSVNRRTRNIDITDKEWEAIQAGAISENTLKKILNNTDIDKLRERATPKLTNTPSPAQISRVKALSASNYTLDEIAKKTGLSTSTISKYLKGVK